MPEAGPKNPIDQQPAYAGPLYFQINELLMERIRSRAWKVGTALPNETDLAREYGVSVGTMRKALQRLEAMGWISRRRGRGTFVSDPYVVLMEKMSHFYANGRRLFPETSEYMSVKLSDPTPTQANQLRVRGDDKLLEIVRCQASPGHVQTYDKIIIAERLVPGLYERGDIPKKLLSVYAEYGIVVTHTVQTLGSVAASDSIAEILNVAVGRPLLTIKRTAYDINDNIIEYCERWCDMQNAEYRLDV